MRGRVGESLLSPSVKKKAGQPEGEERAMGKVKRTGEKQTAKGWDAVNQKWAKKKGK